MLRLNVRDLVRAGLAILAALAAVTAAAVLNLVQVETWEPSRERDLAAVLVLAALAIPPAVRAATRSLRQQTEVDAITAAHATAAAIALIVHEACSIPMRDVAVTVWQVQEYPLNYREARLQKRARYRADDGPAPSDIIWTKGKGIIGRCWGAGDEDPRDWTAFWARHKNCGVEKWNELGTSKTLGLSYDEFKEIAGKYGMVWPFSIKNGDGKCIGVIAVDVPSGHGSTLSSSGDVKRAARTACSTLGRLLD